MVGLDIGFLGDKTQVQRMLDATMEAVSPIGMMPWLQNQMGEYFQQQMEQRFANEGDEAVGGPWLPLTEATLQRKWDGGYPEKINVRTGAMMDYLTTTPPDVTAEGVDTVMEFPGGNPSGKLLTKIETAMLGVDDPPTPPRPVLGMTEADVTFAVMSLAAYLNVAVASRTGATPDPGGVI